MVIPNKNAEIFWMMVIRWSAVAQGPSAEDAALLRRAFQALAKDPSRWPGRAAVAGILSDPIGGDEKPSTLVWVSWGDGLHADIGRM